MDIETNKQDAKIFLLNDKKQTIQIRNNVLMNQTN